MRGRSVVVSSLAGALLGGALLGGASPVLAAEHHAAPDGAADGDGTEAAPWDLVTAFSQPEVVQPGDTIWLHGGVYDVVGTLTGGLLGTQAEPIVVRGVPGERVTLDTGDSNANRVIIQGAYTWYWGFEVTSSAEDRWADDGSNAERGFSIDVQGQTTGIKLINLVVHDTGGAIGFWGNEQQGELYGCIIYYNGYDADDRGHGHAIYSQNVTGTKRLAHNIMFGQYSHGIHVYTEGGQIDGFVVEGNISFDNGVVSTVSGPTRNILIGGGPVAMDPIARDNVTYFPFPDGGGTSLDLGYGGGTSNAMVEGNVSVGGGTSFRLAGPGASVSGNVFVGPTDGADAATFPDNEFHRAAPTGPIVRVFPNEYESGRGHVAIVNFDLQDEVEIDPGDVLQPGDIYEVRDAQNYYGDPVATGTFTGDPILVPMTGTEAAPVVGTPATAFVHTSAAFGAFVLLKTGEDPGGGTGGETTGAGTAGDGTGGGDSSGLTTGGPGGDGGDTSTTDATTSGAQTDGSGSQENADTGCGCRASNTTSGAPLALPLLLLFRRRNKVEA